MRLGAYFAELDPGSKVARRLRRARRVRAAPPPLRVQPRVPRRASRRRLPAARACRPTGAWSSSSSSPATRSGSAPRPIPSSRAGPIGPHPLFREFIGRRWRGPRGATRRSRSSGLPPPERADRTSGVTSAQFRPLGEREIHRGRICERARSGPSRARRHHVRARRRPLARRGRRRAVLFDDGTPESCWCASTGPPSTPSCSRSRPACATSTGNPEETAHRELAEEVGFAGRSPRAADGVLQLGGHDRRPPTSSSPRTSRRWRPRPRAPRRRP